mgnify:CR=1 FL=1|jgi:hypothetical protein
MTGEIKEVKPKAKAAGIRKKAPARRVAAKVEILKDAFKSGDKVERTEFRLFGNKF